ncbi:MAG: hypothetical protein OEM03_10030, partial [Chromatiales bacterium]|nr:hypothetical protein [Chromatiales bacterium]
PKRAPAMTYLWSVSNFPSHNLAMDCQDCHNGQAAYPTFAELHSGYDARITDASDGVKWAEKYTASIDSIDVTDNVVTVEFSVSDADMVPYIYLSFYGYDTKQMIVASHTRDANRARYEAKPDDTNALFEFTPATLGNTSYTAVMDLSLYAAEVVSDIPTLIDEGVIKTGIVTIAPRLYQADGTRLGLDAVIMNFDVSDGTEVANYFTGTDTTVENAKCEVCHDKLAVTFHSGSGRSTVEACRNCHVTTSPGGHVEMQSRSIDSYAHAIHSFQAFDTGEVFNTCLLDEVTGECAEDANGDEIPIADFDPVRAARFDLHIEHTFPNFTILNCEACHTAGTYNPADQSMSMPGVSSAADMPLTWYEKIESGRNDPWSPSWVEDASGRNIGAVPEYVTGPSSRACGGCHRAEFINEDAAGALAAFNGHTDMGGTLVENDEDDVALYAIIEKIMSIF